jgi:seryl-tRNA synthetase
MLDIAVIRDQAKIVKEALASRNEGTQQVDEILDLDAQRRGLLTRIEELRAERNRVSREISRIRDDGERQRLIDSMRVVGDQISAQEGDLKKIEDALSRLMLAVPNLPHESVPVAPDETHNAVLRTWGEPRGFSFEPVPHWDLGPELRILDFERGVKLSGSRFYVMRGAGALLQRSLISWMIDVHVRDQDYTEIYPPAIVKEQCMWGAGQLPKFRDNIYRDIEDDLWLVGTAEIPLTNLHRDEILDAADLPLRYVGYTPCFRREKMSAGRDVRGIKRGHQFDKVEMYKYTAQESSYDELEAMLDNALDICRRLDLPHRVVQLCTGDLGFSASKTYDIEVWAPGCGEWLEVSSVSNCEAFQARRANIRYRPSAGEKPKYVHTLNGSGLALPRVVIGILENYQQEDGSVRVPEPLRPYMGGMDVIERA